MSKVTLSSKTLNVLKNFSTINSSIVFRKGSTVRTISNAENILAKFTGEEIFPVDFAIYDLSQFLSGISLFNDPQLEFTSGDFVSIRGVASLLSIISLILKLRSSQLLKKCKISWF